MPVMETDCPVSGSLGSDVVPCWVVAGEASVRMSQQGGPSGLHWDELKEVETQPKLGLLREGSCRETNR